MKTLRVKQAPPVQQSPSKRPAAAVSLARRYSCFISSGLRWVSGQRRARTRFGCFVVDVAAAGYMQASKLKQHVEFEETLDLGPFMKRRTQQQQQQQQQQPQPRHMYQLCGVVVHDGSSVRSGHYYR